MFNLSVTLTFFSSNNITPINGKGKETEDKGQVRHRGRSLP